MSTEFTAHGAIELTLHGAGSAFVQTLVTRWQDDPLASFEDVHVELDGHTLWLDVYGTSFSCHDRPPCGARQVRETGRDPFCRDRVRRGRRLHLYFGPSRHETAALEVTSR